MADLEAQGAVDALEDFTYVKYLVFTEGNITEPKTSTCGIGENYPDDTPLDLGPNINILDTRAAVDQDCWDINDGGAPPAHELMHTLGAVQSSAPHAGNDGHCTDEYDLMCYGPGVTYRCPAYSNNALFDCGNDDYFNTDPYFTSYTCTHWNTSDSYYLDGWDVIQKPRKVHSLSARFVDGGIEVSFSPTESCYGASKYVVKVAGVGSQKSDNGYAFFPLPAGAVGGFTVTVTPYVGQRGRDLPVNDGERHRCPEQPDAVRGDSAVAHRRTRIRDARLGDGSRDRWAGAHAGHHPECDQPGVRLELHVAGHAGLHRCEPYRGLRVPRSAPSR